MTPTSIHPNHIKPGDIIYWGGEWRTIHTVKPSILPGRTVLYANDPILGRTHCIGTFRNTTTLHKR